MIKLISASVIALVLSASLASGSEPGAVYRCVEKDAVQLAENGMLAKVPEGDVYREHFAAFAVDTLTGAITFSKDGDRQIWHVVPKFGGSDRNDYVLVPPPDWQSADEAARAAATNFIRVRAWSSKPQVKFMAFALDTLITGTCEIVR